MAVTTAHRTDVEPDPAMMSPSPVTYIETGIISTITAIGTTMFTGRSGMPSRGGGAMSSGSARATEWSQCSLPSAVLCCAARIGPMIHLSERAETRQCERRDGVEIQGDRGHEHGHRLGDTQRDARTPRM